MGILSAIFKKKAPEPVKPAATKKAAPKPEKKVSHHNVAGTSFHQAEIKAMGTKNPDYALTKSALFKRDPDAVVYEYTFSPKKAELVPEPENPHDPNAIKVLVDGVHVGYIKAGSCARIHKLLREGRIEKIEPEVFGGRSKYLCSYDTDSKRLSDYDLEEDEGPFGVQLSITETKKPEA